MLLRLTTIFLLVLAGMQSATAQEVPDKKGVIATVREKLKLNTTASDTLKDHSADSLKQTTQHTVDSLTTVPSVVTDSLLQIQSKLDSLEELASFGGVQGKLDSITELPDQVVNSITQKLQQGTGKLEGVSDSLTQKVNTVIESTNERIATTQKKIVTKILGTQEGVNESVDKAQNKVNEGLNPLEQAGVDLPIDNPLDKSLSIETPALQIGTIDNPITGNEGSLPSLNVASPELSGVDIPALDINGNPIQDLTAIDSNLPDIPNAKEYMNKADGYLDEAEKYEGDLRKIKDGDLGDLEKLPEDAEAKVMELDQMKAVNSELTRATQQQAEYEAMIQKYRDKKLLQEEIKRKAMNVANDYMKEMGPAIQKAQENLAKAKRLNPSVKNTKEAFKRRPNTMKDKPTMKRFVPGITVQAYNQDIFKMDLGVQVGFRISGKLTTGVGGIYRVGFSDQYTYLVKGEGVWGYRTFVNLEVIKGFGVYGEYEGLIVTDPTLVGFLEADRSVIHAAYGGIGKAFPISRRIRGSLVVLYRFEWDETLPSMNKFNFRAGFHWNLLARKKSTWLK